MAIPRAIQAKTKDNLNFCLLYGQFKLKPKLFHLVPTNDYRRQI